MKPATHRVGGALVAALLAAPLGAGIASAAEVPDATTVEETTAATDTAATDTGTATDTGASDTATDTGTTDTGAATDSTTATDTGATDTATDTGTTDTGATDTAATDTGTATDTGATDTTTDTGTTDTGTGTTDTGATDTAATEPVPEETTTETVQSDVVVTSLEMSYSFLATVQWLPSGTYTTQLANLAVDGNTATSKAYDLTVTWSYSLNGAAFVEFTPVSGAASITGLTVGENSLVIQASYTNPATEETGTVQLFAAAAPSIVTTSVTLAVTAQTMAETVAELNQDLTIPSSTRTSGTSGTFKAPAGFFTPGETVTVTLVPTDGGAPVTLAVGTAAADGSFVLDTTLADTQAGTYYLIVEGLTTAGYNRVTVNAAPAVVTGTAAAAVADPTAVTSAVSAATTTAATSGSTQLATTGTDPSTGLLVGGLVTLVGAGAVLGARKLRSARAEG